MAVDKLDVVLLAKKGLTAAEIAKLRDVSEPFIQKLLDEARAKGAFGYQAKMTQEKRRETRKEIAEFVRAGGTVEQAIGKWEVTRSYVKRSCTEHGVEFPDTAGGARVSGYKIIALLIGQPEMKEADVARKLNVTPQYINLVRGKANKEGLLLAIERAKDRAVKEAMKEIGGKRK